MYSNDEIKQRFKAGILVDRHGFEVTSLVDMQESTLFLRLAHYRLLDGMAKTAVTKKLMEFECSSFEAKVVVDESLAFIRDVLEIDLDEHVKSHSSTIGHCNRLLTTITQKCNQWYREQQHLPIELQGHTFDADADARSALITTISTSATPAYWTDINNENVADWSLTRTKQLLGAISERDTELHEVVAKLKRDARISCEKKELIKLQKFELPE